MTEQKKYVGRKSPRLRGYDYAEPGFYFLTICAHARRCIFGKIENARLVPSRLGLAVQQCWNSIPAHSPGVETDGFILMPNHLHGIIRIVQPNSYSVSGVVGLFKAAVTRSSRTFNENTTIWQRSFHDRVIRTENSLFALRQYILDNPEQWHADELNPGRD